MGVSIDAHVYDLETLESQIDAWVVKTGGYREDAVTPKEFLHRVCSHFGMVTDEHFIVIFNEYYEDYNPCSQFFRAVEEYFFPGKDTYFYASSYTTIEGGVEFELGDVFPDFEYGGKFNPDDDY